MNTFDLIVIGGGRASNLALSAGKSGKKVALIEKSSLGGTCPNRGCVPSKLLIGYAHVARAIKESSRHFISSSIQNIDLESIFQETNNYVNQVGSKYQTRLDPYVKIFKGKATFVSNNQVEVNGQILNAENIVIATGTRPKPAEHEKAWTSDDVFPLMGKIPQSITIVGSGFIACELANFFDAVGIETKLLARSNHLLSHEDAEISQIFKEEFCKNVDVSFNTSIVDIKHENDEFLMTLKTKDGKQSTHKSEALLYATGRMSNADTLGLENTSIKLDTKGFIQRDEFFETSAKGVYVVGDASGQHMLQHAASYEVNYLGKTLYVGEKQPLVFKYMPHAVFTDPEIASVGLTEEQAKKENLDYVTSTSGWLASAKVMSTRLDYQRTKFLVDPKTYKILGCHMIGPESSSMIHQVLAVMHIDNDIRHLKEMLYIHPALNEAILPAAVDIIKKIVKQPFS
jgi:dihydrolipoamide dehydrogenase